MLVLQVLDWNTKAQSLYESLGGKIIHSYIPVRFNRQELNTLGQARAETEQVNLQGSVQC